MAVLTKGVDFATNQQLSASDLDNLVDLATFASGAVDNVTTQLSGGAIIVKDAGITPAKLSTGHPTWNTDGELSATSLENTPIGEVTPSSAVVTTLEATGDVTFGAAFELTGDLVQVEEGGTGADTVADARAAFSFDTLKTVTYASSVALDLDDLEDLKTVALTGNISLTTTNRAAGRTYVLRIVGDGSSRTITVSSSWAFVGRQPSTNTFTLGANKTAILVLMCYGTAETDIVAAYSDKP